MSEGKRIRGIATQREGQEGYIVVLDSGDLADWLRQEHALTTAEQKVVHEIADHIETFAMQVLNEELARREVGLDTH